MMPVLQHQISSNSFQQRLSSPASRFPPPAFRLYCTFAPNIADASIFCIRSISVV